MVLPSPIDIAIGGYAQIQNDWMSATQLRALIFEDPILIWLDHHGEANGFYKDTSDYEFLPFIFRKGHEFEAKWTKEMAGAAIRVCDYAYEVRDSAKVKQTWKLMRAGTSVIAQPALWWAPEKIHGVPDFIVLSSWLEEHFPGAIQPEQVRHPTLNLGLPPGLGHYMVIDLKFTSNLTSSQKATDLLNYSAQVRLYSYMVGQLQGYIPAWALLVQRQPVDQFIPVQISSVLGEPLDHDLALQRDRYLKIKLEGRDWKPWQIPELHPNLGNDGDDPWHSAKTEMAENYVDGASIDLVCEIKSQRKKALADMGYMTRASLLAKEPETIPFESIHGVGPVLAGRIRAVVRANRTSALTPTRPSRVPSKKPFEFFVDFEFFNNLNVDFEQQWPTLEGYEMIFMVGVGYDSSPDQWEFEKFIASAQSHVAERAMLDEFMHFLVNKTDGKLEDPDEVALYHWSSAEVWQMRRAADRHGLSDSHIWRNLPWVDL